MAAFLAYIWISIHRAIHRGETPDNRYSLPFPTSRHVTLGEDVIKDKSVIVIGDVHGCANELAELLELAQTEEPGKTILPIFVGDIISKGPKSIEALRKVRGLEAYTVRGNHEEIALREVFRQQLDESYETRDEYNWINGLTRSDINYLIELPYTISIPSFNAIVVHAGLVPEIILENQDYSNMVKMTNLKRHGEKFIVSKCKNNNDNLEAWASVWRGPEHVYFGHDASRKLQKYSHAIGLDTGCVYGGELTGIFLNGCKKLISVKAHQKYKEPKDK